MVCFVRMCRQVRRHLVEFLLDITTIIHFLLQKVETSTCSDTYGGVPDQQPGRLGFDL